VLPEVWRGLKQKLALQCASPRVLGGKSWAVMDVFCSQAADDKPNPSVLTTAFIVTGVLLVCAIGGGLIWRMW
jgi:hypothetical protein